MCVCVCVCVCTCGRKDGDLAGVSAILDSEEGALCSCMIDEGAAVGLRIILLMNLCRNIFSCCLCVCVCARVCTNETASANRAHFLASQFSRQAPFFVPSVFSHFSANAFFFLREASSQRAEQTNCSFVFKYILADLLIIPECNDMSLICAADN